MSTLKQKKTNDAQVISDLGTDSLRKPLIVVSGAEAVEAVWQEEKREMDLPLASEKEEWSKRLSSAHKSIQKFMVEL